MQLSGLHLLLTYSCTLECDHCFVWGSPWQSGTMTLASVRRILQQARDVGTVDWIYFEGGEPFLHYRVLRRGVELAAELGFHVGIVSNGYWATDVADAVEWLSPLAGLVQDLSISDDDYHGDGAQREHARNAIAAAEELGIPSAIIAIAPPEATSAARVCGQIPSGESAVRFRGRAAERLAHRADARPWTSFTECPCEDLREPGRVHVDPYGNVHVCQGICLGNMFRDSLAAICAGYDPDAHPIVGPLLHGGPAELVRTHDLAHAEAYADACQLCCTARHALRSRYTQILVPDQMYGVP